MVQEPYTRYISIRVIHIGCISGDDIENRAPREAVCPMAILYLQFVAISDSNSVFLARQTAIDIMVCTIIVQCS